MNDAAIFFAAGDAWSEYATEHKIENPIFKSIELMDKYSRRLPDGSYTILMEDEYSPEDQALVKQWKQDKYVYMRARDRFMIEWIAENESWDIAHEYAETWDNDWNDLLWYFEEKCKPCTYGECNIFCSKFEDCIKRGFIDGTE